MRVKDCMCRHVVQAAPDTNLNEIAKLMESNEIGCVPICDDKSKVIGFVTDRDIITRCVATSRNCANTKAFEIMTTHVIKTTPDTDASEAARTMSANQIRRLPVIENDRIVGMLSIGDLARNNNISTNHVGMVLEQICDN